MERESLGSLNKTLLDDRDAARIVAREARADRDTAQRSLEKAESDFKTLSKEYASALAVIERLEQQNNAMGANKDDARRALGKASKVIEAMLEHFKPERLAEDDVDPTDADGVAYGEKIGVGDLRYGDLEVAAGALMGVVL